MFSTACISLLTLAIGSSNTQPPSSNDPAFKTFSAWIGDVNGDGHPDLAKSDAFNLDDGFVEIRSGFNNSLIRTFTSPESHLAFGIAILQSPDMDGDNVSDIAIGSLVSDDAESFVGVIHVYSTSSGKEICHIKSLDTATISLGDVKVLGDVNEDKQVNESDLFLWIAASQSPQTGNDPLTYDLNKDGTIDGSDMIELLERLGFSSSAAAETTLVNLVNTGQLLVAESAWSGNETAGDQPVAAFGLIGCLWCTIKCGAELKEAADCGERYQNHIKNVCGPLADQGKYFEYSQCLDDARLNIQAGCIDEVAEGAGECAKCVRKCAPRPSVS
jgi:hypothetical protein